MNRARSLWVRVRPSPANLPRWALLLGVLPLPLWFALEALAAPAPAWRAEYRPRDAGGAGVPAVVFERQLSRYWDKNERAVPGGADARAFAARYGACLSVDAALDVPFMLVATGAASFSLDGVERLKLPSQNVRRSNGAVIHLEPGQHALAVELEGRGWPSIALLASFDGAPPVALGSGRLAPGVRMLAPGSGAEPCSGR